MSEPTIPERIELASQRAALRARLKEAYQKIYNNPFRTHHSVFDPALFRYEAARAYTKDFYKYTPRSLVAPAILLGLIIVTQVSVNRERAAKEEKIQSGQLTYYERAKFATRGLF